MTEPLPGGTLRGLSRFVLLVVSVLFGLVLGLGSAARLSGFEVWDDGLMFSRYAENLANDGELAWNPGDEPTWGLTSLGHLLWVASVRLIARPLGGDPLSWAVLASWLAGWLFVVLILYSARRLSLVAWTAVCLGVGFGSWGAHFGTGMDTMSALSWLTLFFILVRQWTRATGRATALGAAVSLMAGATFFVRPDATLFPAAVLTALVLWGPDRSSRRHAAAVLTGALVVGGLLWLIAWRYFGTALPLPFYVKSGGHHYGEAFAAEYAGVAGHELWLFVVAFWLPLLAVLLDVMVGPRSWWRGTTAVEKGLALATPAFIVYHLTQVAPIMGGSQRFYQPVVPALLWLSWRAVDRWRARAAASRSSSSWRAVLASVALLAVVALTWSTVIEGRRMARTVERESWPTLDLDTAWRQRATRYWPALDLVARMPPQTVVAATEVGLPGVMNPHKTLIDMAGLHDAAFALDGFSAELLFRGEEGAPRRPDVIYLPHPHYETMLRELLDHPVLRREYRVYEGRDLDSVLGVAIRKGSLAEAPMTAALDEISTGARSRS